MIDDGKFLFGFLSMLFFTFLCGYLAYKASEIEYIEKPRYVTEVLKKEQNSNNVEYIVKTETLNHKTVSEENHIRDFSDKAIEVGDELIEYQDKSQTFIKVFFIIVTLLMIGLSGYLMYEYLQGN